MHNRFSILYILFSICIVLLLLNLICGSVSIPIDQVVRVLMGGEAEKASWTYIIIESRLPQAITAILCGASLSASGLLLQTLFRNPLAGPSILGITNGASLGVAIVMLACGGAIANVAGGYLAIVLAAFAGALAVMAALLGLSSLLRSNIVLLIVGIMVSYLTSSVITLLNAFANADNLQSYVMWGMGSFSDVSLPQLPVFATMSLIALALALTLIKPLNALLLGDGYAQNLGVDTRRVRRMLLVITGMLTAAATAFCGPVAFIGLAVPHLTRFLCRTFDLRILLPSTMLCGSAVCMLCNLLSILPPNSILPINAVTPIIGVPVILYVILRRK